MKGDVILTSDSNSYDENVRERLKSMQEKCVILSFVILSLFSFVDYHLINL